MDTNTHIYKDAHTHKYIYMCIDKHICANIDGHMHIHTKKIQIYTDDTRENIHMYNNTHTYIHTYIHTLHILYTHHAVVPILLHERGEHTSVE